MLWMELCPCKTQRLNPNPQSDSLWGQGWKEIIKVNWDHNGGALIWWHWRPHKRGRESLSSVPVLTNKRSCEHNEIQTACKAREEASEWSLSYLHKTYLVLDCLASQMVRNQFQLFKPPGVEYLLWLPELPNRINHYPTCCWSEHISISQEPL